MLDVLCSELPARGARIHAEVRVQPGGSAVNAASAAAAAGATASVLGRIGDDRAGDHILAHLAALGIIATLARDPELPTGAAVAFADDGGGTSVVATRGANARFAVNDVPATVDADALLVSGFALFQSGTDAAAQAAIDRFTGAWLGVDVGSPALARAARTQLAELVRGDTVVFATAEEARELTDAGPEDAARELASLFSVACVKLGQEGAIAAAGDVLERCRVESRPPRSAFGAGDAFAGTVLVALARRESLGRALEQGCEAGARAAARDRAGDP